MKDKSQNKNVGNSICLVMCSCILLLATMSCSMAGDPHELTVEFSGAQTAAENNSSVENNTGSVDIKNDSPGPYDESIRVMDMENLQYLALHKIDFTGSGGWDVSNPESFNQDKINEILDAVGTRGTPSRRLAVSYTFSYLQYPAEKVADSVKNMLELSEQNDIPVILHLDGVNWWGTRPDLWNFWDESAVGYNPDNIGNVERSDWDMDAAVKIGWRNWASQIRVSPAPNLASPAFLAEQTKALDIILPVISEWYDALPSERKYLLGGVVLGWELSTYVQAYYFENGNDLIDKPSSQDPDPAAEGGSVWNTVALGYAAAQTLGIQSEGIITEETQDKICSFYVEFLIETALRHGINPKRIITHSFYGGRTKRGGGQTGAASISSVEGVTPGWSWYDADFNEIDKCVDMAGGKPWAAIEVRPWNLDVDTLEGLFSHRNNRYVNIYNWESIKDDRNTINALKVVLKGKR